MATTSYWCYRCSRFVRVWNREPVTCPDCDGGFVEEIDESPRRFMADSYRQRRGSRRFSAAEMHMIGGGSNWSTASTSSAENSDINIDEPGRGTSSRGTIVRRSRRNGGDRSPFNPVIVLRGGGGGSSRRSDDFGSGGGAVPPVDRGFQLYYDDGGGSGLRPLPPNMSEFLLGPGFDRLLDQISQIDVNNIGSNNGRCEHPPASKAAIEALPSIEVNTIHLETESQSNCAVCKEIFELGTVAREMPCKHIYHSDCILPWLALRNSCPVCRHQLPPDDDGDGTFEEGGVARGEDDEDDAVGLTIWRLPRGGFAVGRFAGARRASGEGGIGAEREMPVVYTEVDGGFNNGGLPRRISWGPRGNREGRDRGGLTGRFLRSLFGCFSVTASSSSGSDSRLGRSTSLSLFNTSTRRRSWGMEADRERRRS